MSPIHETVGVVLDRDVSERLVGRRGSTGIGWHCSECKYQSQGVWQDASDASRSLAHHMEHWCPNRYQRVEMKGARYG